MCKKFFHPASADNLKRVWIATKKAEVEKKKQDELRTQYDREQELYQNKALLSKESKERLELNFMYEPPPGVKKIGEGDKEEGEPEYKFEWQRTWGHAPKESYLSQGDDFNEQPFGIQVCQAKCIKCGKYGHMNTDKRCTLYGKSLDHDTPIQNVDQSKLLNEMKAEGLAMRYSSWDMKREAGPNHSMVEEERGVDRVELLKTMNKDEKKKLLKKLKKMEKKQKKEKKKKSSRKSESDDDEWQEKTINGVTSDKTAANSSVTGVEHSFSHETKNKSSKEVKVERRKGENGNSRDARRDRRRDSSEDDQTSNRSERNRGRNGERDRDRSGDRNRERSKERKGETSGERNRDRSGERRRNRSRERRRERSSERDRERSGDRKADRRRNRSGDRQRVRPISRERERRERS